MEVVLKQVPDTNFKCSTTDPCVSVDQSAGAVVTHHVDDIHGPGFGIIVSEGDGLLDDAVVGALGSVGA